MQIYLLARSSILMPKWPVGKAARGVGLGWPPTAWGDRLGTNRVLTTPRRAACLTAGPGLKTSLKLSY